MSRRKLIEAYWRDGLRQPLRMVAQELNVSHNTVRNWLIFFDLYESHSPNRGGKKPKHN